MDHQQIELPQAKRQKITTHYLEPVSDGVILDSSADIDDHHNNNTQDYHNNNGFQNSRRKVALQPNAEPTISPPATEKQPKGVDDFVASMTFAQRGKRRQGQNPQPEKYKEPTTNTTANKNNNSQQESAVVAKNDPFAEEEDDDFFRSFFSGCECCDEDDGNSSGRPISSIPDPILRAIREHQRIKTQQEQQEYSHAATGIVGKREQQEHFLFRPPRPTQERSLLQRQGQISVWEWILPPEAEPLCEYGNSSHRFIWVRQLVPSTTTTTPQSDGRRPRRVVKSIGTKGMIIGSQAEEESRPCMDWEQGQVYFVPSLSNSKVVGWINSTSVSPTGTSESFPTTPESSVERTHETWRSESVGTSTTAAQSDKTCSIDNEEKSPLVLLTIAKVPNDSAVLQKLLLQEQHSQDETIRNLPVLEQNHAYDGPRWYATLVKIALEMLQQQPPPPPPQNYNNEPSPTTQQPPTSFPVQDKNVVQLLKNVMSRQT